MRIENIISTLNKELISAFALLDRTFDEKKEFLQFCSDGKTVLELLDHVAGINHSLLLMISEGSSIALRQVADEKVTDGILDEYGLRLPLHSDALASFDTRPTEIDSNLPHQIRFRLRYQLGECFDHLEALQNGEGLFHEVFISDSIGKMDLYHCIYLLALHTRHHVDQIEKLQAQFEDSIEMK